MISDQQMIGNACHDAATYIEALARLDFRALNLIYGNADPCSVASALGMAIVNCIDAEGQAILVNYLRSPALANSTAVHRRGS